MINLESESDTKSPFRNILLLSIEDLNDWIEPLGGHPQSLTPNLSKLARRSTFFTSAMSPAPACGPSRAATLFGQAPWKTGLYTNKSNWLKVYDDSSVSLIGSARSAGWKTIGAGKVFYKPVKDGQAWSKTHKNYQDKFQNPLSKACRDGLIKRNFDFGPAREEDLPLADDKSVEYIISQIEPGAQNTLWAFGSRRPHTPYIAPKKYFDLFPGPIQHPPGLGQKKFDPDNRNVIDGLPIVVIENVVGRSKRGLGATLCKTGEYDQFIRGYLACIAYADALVGRLLDHLDSVGLTDSTLIVLWSDHGYQLGEKLVFKKFTLWERSLRVPFAFAGPGIMPQIVHEPVSLLDLYPTVSNLVGLNSPHRLDGDDLSTVLSGGSRPVGVAISSWCVSNDDAMLCSTVRTSDYRLIKYWDGSQELYNSADDPFEQNNLLRPGVTIDGNLGSIVENLQKLLPEAMAVPVFD